jgi:hypothetical protein
VLAVRPLTAACVRVYGVSRRLAAVVVTGVCVRVCTIELCKGGG